MAPAISKIPNIATPTIDQIGTSTVKPIATPNPLVSGTPKPYQAPVETTPKISTAPVKPVSTTPLKVDLSRQAQDLAGSTAALPAITTPKPFVPVSTAPIQSKLPGIVTPAPIQTATLSDPNSLQNKAAP